MTTSYIDYQNDSQYLLNSLRDFAAQFWNVPMDAEIADELAMSYKLSAHIQLLSETALIELGWNSDYNQFSLGFFGDEDGEEAEYLLNVSDVEDITHDVLGDVFEMASEAGFKLY